MKNECLSDLTFRNSEYEKYDWIGILIMSLVDYRDGGFENQVNHILSENFDTDMKCTVREISALSNMCKEQDQINELINDLDIHFDLKMFILTNLHDYYGDYAGEWVCEVTDRY